MSLKPERFAVDLDLTAEHQENSRKHEFEPDFSEENLKRQAIDNALAVLEDSDVFLQEINTHPDAQLSRELAFLDGDTVDALEDAGLLQDFIFNLTRLKHGRPSLARIIAKRGYPLTVLKNLDKFLLDQNTIDPALVKDIAYSGLPLNDELVKLYDKLIAATTREEIQKTVEALRTASIREFVNTSRAKEINPDEGFDERIKTRLLRDLSVDGAMLEKLRTSEGEEFMEHLLYFLEKTGDWKKPEDWEKIVSSLVEIREIDDEHALEHMLSLLPIATYSEIPNADKWITRQRLIRGKPLLKRTITEFLNDPENNTVLDQLFLSVRLLDAAGFDEEMKREYAPIVRELFLHQDVLFKKKSTHQPSVYQYDMNQLMRILVNYAKVMDNSTTTMTTYRHILEARQTRTAAAFTKQSIENIIHPLTQALEAPDREQLIQDTFIYTESIDEQTNLAVGILTIDDPEIQRYGREILQKKGVPTDEGVLDTWKHCAPPDEYEKKLEAEIHATLELESERPGSVAVLRKEFGIENFSRYSQELLIEQYDTRDDINVPYGIVVNPKTDWNGAFNRFSSYGEDPVDSIRRQADGQFRTRVYEVASRTGLARALLTTRRRYARRGGGKILFAMIGGHGTKDSIQLGEGAHAVHLQTSDLIGRGAARAGGEFFEPDVNVILRSCSTGQEGGIAQKLSKVLGGRVIAPEVPTFLESIDLQMRTDGKPEFTVTYNESTGVAYQAGVRPERDVSTK